MVTSVIPMLSVIMPVRNEACTIMQVLDDLAAQDLVGDFEVVIADGRSDDATRELVQQRAASEQRFALRVVDNPATTIPAGLNAAIAASRGPLIVRIDGHCRLSSDYLRLIHDALLLHGNDVAGPHIEQISGSSGAIPGAISTLLGTKLGTGGTPARSALRRTVRTTHSVMSSFRREVWEHIGGFDESMLSNEDFDFDWRAGQAGALVASLPHPTFRLVARSTLMRLAKQRLRYGWWKAAVLTKHPDSLHVRQVVPVAALLAVVVGTCWWWPVAVIAALMHLTVCVLAGMMARPPEGAGLWRRLQTALLAPLIYAIIHGGWTAGLLAGLLANRYRQSSKKARILGCGSLIPRSADLPGSPRVAVIHDWLETCGGSEQVLAEILHLVPRARLFSLVDHRDDATDRLLHGRISTTTFIQRLPWSAKWFRRLLPLMPFAIEQLDLGDFDLVISSSHAVAKGVIVKPQARHVCYCHSPLRYAWDQQHHYDRSGTFGRGPMRWMSLWMLHRLRLWDASSSKRVDRFVANSTFVAERIARYYRRSADVVFPPVDVERFPVTLNKGADYVVVSRLVPYKRIDVIIEAFAHLPQRTLAIVGDGPERQHLERLAGDNVRFLGWQSDQDVARIIGHAKAFLFAAEEDFGIVVVEAQAAGTPAIAYGRGGARDTVIDGVTGIHFHQQHPASIAAALERCEANYAQFDPVSMSRRAQAFAPQRFREAMRSIIHEVMAECRETTASFADDHS